MAGAWLVCVMTPDQTARADSPPGYVVSWGYDYNPYQTPGGLSNIISIVPGLALASDGSLVSWGNNAYGEKNVPSNLTNVAAIAGGSFHRLALRSNGTVVAWGAGTTNSGVYPHYGQAVVPAGLTNVVAIAAGWRHSLALRADGMVVAWGFNYFGQTNVPSGLTNVVSIAAAADGDYSLALRADGKVVAWGYGYYGETNVPQDLAGVVSIAAGPHHGLALKADGTVIVWGMNEPGQTNVPSGLNGVAEVAGGRVHSLARRTNGTVVAWGGNPYGQTNVPWGMTNATGISAAGDHSFAITDGSPLLLSLPSDLTIYSGNYGNFLHGVGFRMTASGAMPLTYQWLFNGTNILGATNSFLSFETLQPGDSGNYSVIVGNTHGTISSPGAELTVTDSPPIITEQPVSQTVSPGWDGLFLIVYAAGSHPQSFQWRFNGTNISGATGQYLVMDNVQITNAGNYDVMVSNVFGAVTSSVAALKVLPSSVVAWGGNGNGQKNVPLGLTNALAIAAGMYHSQALRSDGTVVAWGDNNYGQENVPIGLSNVIAIAAGTTHGLALRSNGTVVAWGSDSPVTNVPPGLSGVVAVAAGNWFSLALKNDGMVVVWGNRFAEATNLPPGLTNVVAIAAGYFHGLALQNSGTVIGWPPFSAGGNVPGGLSNVIAIAAGYSHSLALKSDGTVAAWGVSYQGYGGPVTPPVGLRNVVAITAGGHYFGDHSLALRSEGTVVAWGVNDSGQTNIPPGLTNVLTIAAGGWHSLALVGTNRPVTQATITSVTRSTGDHFELSIPTGSGRVYQLEYKNTLAEDDWIALPLVAGTGRTVTLIDPTANTSQRFYRVRQW